MQKRGHLATITSSWTSSFLPSVFCIIFSPVSYNESTCIIKQSSSNCIILPPVFSKWIILHHPFKSSSLLCHTIIIQFYYPLSCIIQLSSNYIILTVSILIAESITTTIMIIITTTIMIITTTMIIQCILNLWCLPLSASELWEDIRSFCRVFLQINPNLKQWQDSTQE